MSGDYCHCTNYAPDKLRNPLSVLWGRLPLPTFPPRIGARVNREDLGHLSLGEARDTSSPPQDAPGGSPVV
jgi:hypothetical protein